MGSAGTIIFLIIFVTVWVIKGLSAVMGDKNNNNDAQRKPRSLEDWDELQARRRAELAQQSRQREGLEELRIEDTYPAGAGQADPSQMTMAERIELARQRARKELVREAGQADERAEALRQARELAEREADQRQRQARQQAQREEAERQRAARERERQVAERRRRAEQKAQAEREQLRKSRARRRSTSGAKQAQSAARPVPIVPGQPTRAASSQRALKGHGQPRLVETGTSKRRKAGVSVGPLDAASLRQAFILKELLDKPLAMRNPQDDLLS